MEGWYKIKRHHQDRGELHISVQFTPITPMADISQVRDISEKMAIFFGRARLKFQFECWVDAIGPETDFKIENSEKVVNKWSPNSRKKTSIFDNFSILKHVLGV